MKIIRSLAMILGIVTALVVTTGGYFRSTVQANNNLFITGSLRLALDSLDANGQPITLISDENGTAQQKASLSTMSDFLPGQIRSVYFSVRNSGTIPLNYRINLSGTWGDQALDAQDVMQLTQVKRFSASECASDQSCNAVRSWLTNNGSQFVGTSTVSGDLGSISKVGGSDYLTEVDTVLASNQFSLFKVDITMSSDADNAFQGKTFTYSLNAQAKQTTATSF